MYAVTVFTLPDVLKDGRLVPSKVLTHGVSFAEKSVLRERLQARAFKPIDPETASEEVSVGLLSPFHPEPLPDVGESSAARPLAYRQELQEQLSPSSLLIEDWLFLRVRKQTLKVPVQALRSQLRKQEARWRAEHPEDTSRAVKRAMRELTPILKVGLRKTAVPQNREFDIAVNTRTRKAYVQSATQGLLDAAVAVLASLLDVDPKEQTLQALNPAEQRLEACQALWDGLPNVRTVTPPVDTADSGEGDDGETRALPATCGLPEAEFLLWLVYYSEVLGGEVAEGVTCQYEGVAKLTAPKYRRRMTVASTATDITDLLFALAGGALPVQVTLTVGGEENRTRVSLDTALRLTGVRYGIVVDAETDYDGLQGDAAVRALAAQQVTDQLHALAKKWMSLKNDTKAYTALVHSMQEWFADAVVTA